MRELKGMGFGNRTVGYMLGYSDRYIMDICHDFDIPSTKDRKAMIHYILKTFPPHLCQRIAAIRARNHNYFNEKADAHGVVERKRYLNLAPHGEHRLVDTEGDTLDNMPVQSRPEKAKEAA